MRSENAPINGIPIPPQRLEIMKPCELRMKSFWVVRIIYKSAVTFTSDIWRKKWPIFFEKMGLSKSLPILVRIHSVRRQQAVKDILNCRINRHLKLAAGTCSGQCDPIGSRERICLHLQHPAGVIARPSQLHLAVVHRK